MNFFHPAPIKEIRIFSHFALDFLPPMRYNLPGERERVIPYEPLTDTTTNTHYTHYEYHI